MEDTTLNEALEQLDKDFEEETEEVEEEVIEEEDTDLEYDEDGNVIIPDDDEGDEEAIADDADKGEGEQPPVEAKATEPNEKHSKLLAQAKDTLLKLGYKVDTDEEIMNGLVQLAAETEDKTTEEYLKEKAERDKLEEAKRVVEERERDEVRNADLKKLHETFPETQEYTNIEQVPNFKRFAELRMLGLSADEAYSASHTNAIRTTAAAGAKKLANSKSHLQPSAPKGAKDDSLYISKGDMAMFRELMPDKTDDEIREYYKRTQK